MPTKLTTSSPSWAGSSLLHHFIPVLPASPDLESLTIFGKTAASFLSRLCLEAGPQGHGGERLESRGFRRGQSVGWYLMNLTMNKCSPRCRVAGREGSRNPKRRMVPFQTSSSLKSGPSCGQDRGAAGRNPEEKPRQFCATPGYTGAKDTVKSCKTVPHYRKWSPLLLPPLMAVPLLYRGKSC